MNTFLTFSPTLASTAHLGMCRKFFVPAATQVGNFFSNNSSCRGRISKKLNGSGNVEYDFCFRCVVDASVDEGQQEEVLVTRPQRAERDTESHFRESYFSVVTQTTFVRFSFFGRDKGSTLPVAPFEHEFGKLFSSSSAERVGGALRCANTITASLECVLFCAGLQGYRCCRQSHQSFDEEPRGFVNFDALWFVLPRIPQNFSLSE